MTRNEILETIIGLFVLVLLAAGIVWLGWDEPLSYRFMSRAEINERELVLHPPPPPPVKAAWVPQGSGLERPPETWEQRDRNRNRPMGIPTENARRIDLPSR